MCLHGLAQVTPALRRVGWFYPLVSWHEFMCTVYSNNLHLQTGHKNLLHSNKNEVYSTPHDSWPPDTIRLHTEQAKTGTINRDKFYCTFSEPCAVIYIYIYICVWLRGCVNSRTVPGSIPGGVTVFFSDIFPSDPTMELGSTQPLVKMTTRNISWG